MATDKLQINKLFALSSENRKFSFSLPLKHTIKIGKRDYEVKLKSDEKAWNIYPYGKTVNILLR